MNITRNILISLFIAFFVMVGVLNLPASWFSIKQLVNYDLGALSTTDLQSTDNLTDFPTLYNANLAIIDSEVFELSAWFATTSATQLVEVGTITTGTWQGTAIDVARQGTGTTSPSLNHVMLGNGASGFKTPIGLGTSGQVLTSAGAATPPAWGNTSVALGDPYAWTGDHSWKGAATSSLFAVTGTAYFGATATSTFDSAGNLSLIGNLVIGGDTINDFVGPGHTVTSGALINDRYSLSQHTDLDASGEGGVAYATSTALVIPASGLSASSTIQIVGSLSCQETSANGGNCAVELRDSTGVTIGDCDITATNSKTVVGTFNLWTINNGATNSQRSTCSGTMTATDGSMAGALIDEFTASVETSGGITFHLVLIGTSAVAKINQFTMIINP